MKYIIVIEDTEQGVSIRADLLQTPNEAAGGHAESAAIELGGFLTNAAECWVATQHMDISQTQAFIQSVTNKPTIN